jgi:type IV secretory pathway TraG/TraD family ATPase VirD4
MAKHSQTVIDLFEELLQLIGEFFGLTWNTLFKRSAPKGYDATLTSPGKILSRWNKGFSMGGVYSATEKSSWQHLLCAGGSGLGKSTTVVVPTLLKMCGRGSFVVLDPSMENYENTAGYYASKGYHIIRINFSDRDGSESDGWNPFPKDQRDFPNFIDTIVSLQLGAESRDPYWQIQAGSLLTTLGKPLYRVSLHQCTMVNLLYLLNMLAAKPKLVDDFMSEYADEATWLEYLAFNKNSDNVRSSILSTAKAVLSVFSQESIQRITSYPTFDMSLVRKEKTIIYVQTSAAELILYKMLISLFFEQLITQVLRKLPSADDLNLWLILDEAGIYRINALPLGVTQARKMRCGIALLVQNEQQLYALYNREQASTIISNCYSRMYLTNQPISTAREIEEVMGKTQYKDDDGITRTRPVRTSDEIRSMEPNKAIVLHGHHRPAIVRLKPFYKQPRLRRLASIEPPQLRRRLPEGPVHLLPLSELVTHKTSDGSTR